MNIRRNIVIWLMCVLYWQMQKLKEFGPEDADLSTELLKWHIAMDSKRRRS